MQLGNIIHVYDCISLIITLNALVICLQVVPLALEPVNDTNVVVGTVFMLLPGDEHRPVKAVLASTLLTWKLSMAPRRDNKTVTVSDESMESSV